ncbi:MAG: hypothetical protein KKH83_06005 [Candidatus Margulisbacteria bacterium]|nr:hypothetical protein [Candidatus Margulisiibacteriota bacterium]
MSALRQLLNDNKFTLITCLPEDNPAYARLAQEAGADALLVREHFALEDIVAAVDIPVGLDTVTNEDLADKDFKKMIKLVDFVNFVPEALLQVKALNDLTRVIALDDTFSIEQLMAYKEKGADALDAAILPGRIGKKELMIGDLQQYITICITSGLPVIIPTQKVIKPSEVAIIEDAGAKGLILTETVLGNSERSFEKALREFRIAVDDLG